MSRLKYLPGVRVSIFFPFAFRGERTWATRDKVNLDGKYTCMPRTLSV